MARRLLSLMSVLCMVAAARSAGAEPVPILNPGFENPAVGYLGVPTGWTRNGDVSVWNITASGFWTVPAPEGNQVGTFVGVGVAGPATASQVVGVLEPNVVYTLSGYVGHPIGWGQSRGTVYFAQLWAGPHLLASTQGTGPDGRFQAFQLTFDSAGSTWVGLPLQIVIGSNQAQTSFDDIRLDATRTTTNAAPTADAGDNQSVRLGVPVTLDGSRSFDDNTATEQLQYAWRIVSAPVGSVVTLDGWNTMTPTLVPDLAGSYLIALVVTDQGGLSSAPSQVTISENPPPVADAGIDQLVLLGGVVTLAGSGVDPDGDSMSYSWELVEKPTGSASQVSNPSLPTATFVPDRPGTYVAQLTVSDFLGAGEPDRTIITVTTIADYAAVQLQLASSQIVGLAVDTVSSRGNQNALTRFLSNATVALQVGDLVTALDQIEQAMSRTDGCALRGTADGNGPGRDWLTTCEAQSLVYPLLLDAATAIASQ